MKGLNSLKLLIESYFCQALKSVQEHCYNVVPEAHHAQLLRSPCNKKRSEEDTRAPSKPETLQPPYKPEKA